MREDSLTWGLVIATKDRLEPLKTCVDLALKQSRPPIEVVVADSSAAWEDHARQIGEIVAAHPQVRLVYEQGVAPSLTMQRNQAVALARADIVFMIDDDSFMYPDCAAEVMTVYDADPEKMVAGVQTFPSPHPEGVGVADAKKEMVDVGPMLDRGGLKGWLLRHVLGAGGDQAFHPYDGAYPDLPLPQAVRGLNVVQVRFFGGFRMTYRREYVLQSPFEPLLRYYCPDEDLDASYRISRLGALVTAQKARAHHFMSATGRLNRAQVMTLRLLNHALFFRKNIPDLREARRVYRKRMARRFLSESLKDLVTLELRLPRLRGVLRAARLAPRIFTLPEAELASYYPALQEKIVKG